LSAQPRERTRERVNALGVSAASSASTPSGRIAICQHGASVLSPSGPRPSTSERVTAQERSVSRRARRGHGAREGRAFDVVHQDRLQRAHLLLLLRRVV
jgi:hypothetical protein